MFILGMTQGIIDPAFALPAGIGDIMAGATAIPYAIFLRKGYGWSKYALIVWNVLGIADLVMALSLGFITGQEQLEATGTATFQTLPWVLVPAVGVPATLALHVITLYRLRRWVPMQQ